MDTLEKLREVNSSLKIRSVMESEFSSYGGIITGMPFTDLDEFMLEKSEMPEHGVTYIASEAELEKKDIFDLLSQQVYGGMPIQIGYCTGDNCKLDGLEYHKGSEIVYAVTDVVLLLGHIWDINGNAYSSESVEAFYVPQGCAVELFGTTLHFAPCRVHDDGFKCVIVLPEGTNTELAGKPEHINAESELLFMKNKWLLVHNQAKSLVDDNAYVGIVGDNIKIDI